MADNVVTQSATPATLDPALRIASAEVSFSGQTCQLGLQADVEVAGVEGSRTATLYGPLDTGIVATPNALTALTGVSTSQALKLDGVHVKNQQVAAYTFALANGADQYLIPPTVIPAGETRTWPFYGMPVTGLKHVSSGNNQLTAQCWGRKAI